MIGLLSGPDLGVAMIPQCLVLEWRKGPARVVFSYARQGDGITAHFAAEKSSVRWIKNAIAECCDWFFETYAWCKCVFCMTARPSIERIVRKLGFLYLTDREGLKIYVRYR